MRTVGQGWLGSGRAGLGRSVEGGRSLRRYLEAYYADLGIS